MRHNNLEDATEEIKSIIESQLCSLGFDDAFLVYDNQRKSFYTFDDQNQLEDWIEESYIDYVVECDLVGQKIEQLEIWKYISEEDAEKYSVLYEGAEKFIKIEDTWIYRCPRYCTPEAVINFNLDI